MAKQSDKIESYTLLVILSVLYLCIHTHGAPASATEVFLSQCGFIEDPIVGNGPYPPNPPPSPVSSPPPPGGQCSSAQPNSQCGGIVPGFFYKSRSNLVGGDISTTSSGLPATSCAWNCQQISGCIGFSQRISDGKCTFKNSSSVDVSESNFDYWKMCSTSTYSKPSSGSSYDTSEGILGRFTLPSKNQTPAPKLWSDPLTWPDGVIPGVGNATMANVTIPCYTIVILDIPSVTLGLLRVRGLLKFLDDPRVPQIYVKANFVLIEGQLFIGQPNRPYQQKAIFELTPNLNGNRAPLMYTFSPPAEPKYPRNLGHKTFAVVGGQVRLYGLPGPPNMPSWVRLSKDASDDDTTIQVDADVAGMWPIGGQIVVTSSDYDRNQAESRTIVDVQSTGNGQAIITLDQPLQYSHYGTINGCSDGFGGRFDERAEVMLLSRNIFITGTDEAPPYNYEGGHFMVFMTPFPPQYIEGIELYKMGQQGILGRYPLHFHILGSVPLTVVRKNAVHHSKQRCYVNHASHDLVFDSNVAFNTSGHCFLLEEGGEQNNTWINNLVAVTRAVDVRISLDETDDRPSSFWITNLRNKFIGNVAAGSDESGFWFELRGSVRGNTLAIPSLSSLNPRTTILTLFLNNTSHSNRGVGMRTYPHGLRPRFGWTTYGLNVLDGLKIYRNLGTGFFVHNTDALLITNGLFADNGWGIHFNRNNNINITNTRFIAFSENYGSPSNCWNAGNWSNCRPTDPSVCKMPLKWGVQGRSTGWRNRYTPTFGVTVDPGHGGDYWPYTHKNNSFSNYDRTCNVNAGLVLIGAMKGEYFNPSYNIEGVRFTSNSLPVWMPPRVSAVGLSAYNHGEPSMFFMLYDKDGSILGNGKRGYIVTNVSETLPPGLVNCTARPEMSAYACVGVCYRSVGILYSEPGFTNQSSNVDNTRGMFSSVKFTRLSDGKSFTLDGNLNDPNATRRQYFASLLSKETYRLEIVPPTGRPFFVPDNLTISYRDVGECNGAVTLRIKHPSSGSWTLTSTNIIFQTPCQGVQNFPPDYPFAQYSTVCSNSEPWMDLYMSPGLSWQRMGANNNFTLLVLRNSPFPASCSAVNCSLIWSATDWLYDDSGLERRPSFYNPILSRPSNWNNGKAPLGVPPWWTSLNTVTNAPINTVRATYYFRKTFTLVNSSCYSALYFDILVDDATVVYINNVEVLRINLAPGYLDNKTNALVGKGWNNWESYSVSLNTSSGFSLLDGVNTIAVEQHVVWNAGNYAFDMRLSATRNPNCNVAQKPTFEVCDGLDNDLDGSIDKDVSNNLLTKACNTVCGAGIMTCIDGYFQNCSAIIPTPEICDGKDNNCDGLIDNGRDQLNCPLGTTCFNGGCVAVLNATVPVQLWPRNASGWSFSDKTNPLDETVPTWRTGNTTDTWVKGPAPLGFDFRSPVPAWQNIGTQINAFYASGRTLTAYFAKTFTLDSSQVNNTFNLDFSLRRVDGAIIYLNGVELWRDNMNWGAISALNTSKSSVDGETAEKAYNLCKNCRRNNSYLLKAGVNFITAELHMNYRAKKTSTFDMDLYRNVIAPCPSNSASCVRQVDQSIIQAGSAWKYLDGNFPVPGLNWMMPSYNDSSWPIGLAPLGFATGTPKTVLSNGVVNGSEIRRSFYFRQFVTFAEAACYVQINFSISGKDGFAVYLNGVEAFRNNLPNVPLNSTVFANGSSNNWVNGPILSGGWFNSTSNLIAVEVHRVSWSTSVSFDLQLTGSREAVTCSPDPSSSSIPWRN